MNWFWTLIVWIRTLVQEGKKFWAENKDQIKEIYLNGKDSVKKVNEQVKKELEAKKEKEKIEKAEGAKE